MKNQITTFLHKLNNLDLQSVANKLMSSEYGHGWTVRQTDTAISRYKIFLSVLFIFPEIELVPTKEIDEVWHAHILVDTSVYIQDCQNLFGYILHHRFTAQKQVSHEDSTQPSGLDVTKILFEELFGVGVLGNTELTAAPCVDLPIRRTKPSLTSSACMTVPQPPKQQNESRQLFVGKSR